MESQPHQPQTCPYTTLPDSVRSDLQVIVHFILVFRDTVQIPLHAVVYPHLESSLLNARGTAYLSLTHYMATVCSRSAKGIRSRLQPLSPKERIVNIRELLEKIAADGNVRAHCSIQHAVAPYVRARSSLRDAQRRSYTWIRGADDVSSRFLVGPRRIVASEKDVTDVVKDLSRSGHRADAVAAAWISSRFEQACLAGEKAMASALVTRAAVSELSEDGSSDTADKSQQNESDSEVSGPSDNEKNDRSFVLNSDSAESDEEQSDDSTDDNNDTTDDDWMEGEVFRRRNSAKTRVRGRHRVSAVAISARALRAARREKRRMGDHEDVSVQKKTKSARQSARQCHIKRRSRRLRSQSVM
ncbi:hypothetical protein BWQ96_05915 [Gracilariopsis chorda]|uniref:Uncharacterized protein n=1 Tax=Gracilariopsis chorda TaxID=448386 RepID=A0A2V3IQG9_9FLOR|nr:hypothetical protein BWQ96_05915 [Gracilariopsis chorda]|eukprot:PXF44351.1 hypothetical protein BWQ96_05915 [Gracilariopsis chorda]